MPFSVGLPFLLRPKMELIDLCYRDRRGIHSLRSENAVTGVLTANQMVGQTGIPQDEEKNDAPAPSGTDNG